MNLLSPKTKVVIPANSLITPICKDLMVISIYRDVKPLNILVMTIFMHDGYAIAHPVYDLASSVNSFNRVYNTKFKQEDVKLVDNLLDL